MRYRLYELVIKHESSTALVVWKSLPPSKLSREVVDNLENTLRYGGEPVQVEESAQLHHVGCCI